MTGDELVSHEEDDGLEVHEHAFTPDSKRLVTASGNSTTGRITVWDLQTGQKFFSFQAHNQYVSHLAISPGGQRLATSSNDRTLRIWDLETGQIMRTMKGLAVNGVNNNLTFSPDGKHIAIANGSGVKIWDAKNEPIVQKSLTINGMEHSGGNPIGAAYVAFSPDLGRVAGIARNKVKVWDANSGKEILDLPAHANPVSCVAFSPDGKQLASGDGVLSSRSGTGLDSGAGIVKVWDAHTGRELHSLVGHTHRVMKLAFSADGTRLASVADDQTVKEWDLQTGRELRSFAPNQPRVTSAPAPAIAFSPDTKLLAAGRPGMPIMLWDAQTGDERLSFRGAGYIIAFSPDGKRMVAGSRVHDAQTGEQLFALQGQIGGVWWAAFSPDGKRLATVGEGAVKIWDAQNGQELLNPKTNATLADIVSVVAFSTDGHRLGTVSASGNLTIWDATPLPEKL